MDILVVAPMVEERKKIIDACIDIQAERKLRNNYMVTTCGVGKISAAMTVQGWLATNADTRVDMIALIGYAGGASGFKPGDVVLPDTVTQWDADTPYAPIFDALHEVYPLKGQENVTLLTGDSFVDRRMGRELERTYGPNVIYDMEGAAVAAVAMRERIPLIVVKIISDIPYHKPWRRCKSFEAFVASSGDFRRFVDILEQF